MLARLEIDLDAIRANVAALTALVAPARFAAVVKANAYGHGLADVARALDGQVDRLCVYEVAEAVALRAAGVSARIHVLGPIAAADLATAHAAGAEITLWDRGAYAREAAAVARRAGVPFAVHAKIDTGVARLGVAPSEAPSLIAQCVGDAALRLCGVFSHLAAAEELDSTFTRDQLRAFDAATIGLNPRIERHIAASAAAMLWPQTRLGAVRAGIAIYGIWPSAPTEAIMRERGLALQPALTWRTQLVVVHEIPAQTPVGYCCTFRTTRASRIGVLPIGYAEGLPRSASNRGSALVNGVRVPIVGRICMNMAFVDITDVPTARAGDPVTLVGHDGDARISIEDAATAADTIGYELVARLPSHVPRVYAGSATARSSLSNGARERTF